MCSWKMCPICSSPVKKWAAKATQLGKFQIVRCVHCGFAFVNPRPSYQWYEQYYGEVGHGHEGGASFRSSCAGVCAGVLERERSAPNSTTDAKRMISTVSALGNYRGCRRVLRLLDVGCGYGFFSREAAENGFLVTSLEPASLERKVAARIIGVQPMALPFEDYDSPRDSFEAIVMSQVLEHVWDPNMWLAKARLLLVPGGVIAIALPNFGSIFRIVLGQHEPYITPPAHLNYFNLQSLGALLRKHGFGVRRTQWVSRLPVSAVSKRIPVASKIAGFITLCLKSGCALADVMHLGMMINMYGQRI